MSLHDVYQKQLLDHYHNPRNYGTLDNPDFSTEIISPTCGDSVAFEGTIEDGIITDIRFHGEGSILSQGTASLLSEHVKGTSISYVQNLTHSDVLDMIGIEVGPNRARTVGLPLDVLHKGIAEYVASRSDS